MKNIFLFLILLLLSSGFISAKQPNVEIKINKKIYSFEIAATEKEREKGLMFRKSLGKDSGMLFIYGRMQTMYFYMKNTLIPLDIAFIDEDLKIVDIQSMEPLDETTVKSKKKGMYALEVNKGFYKRENIKIGDKLEFESPVPFIQN